MNSGGVSPLFLSSSCSSSSSLSSSSSSSSSLSVQLSTSDVSNNVPKDKMTPVVEPVDENSSKLLAFLHNLAGYVDIEVDAILKDHCYARPWNWKPENIYVKPIRRLFFPKSQEQRSEKVKQNDDEIDVETVDSKVSLLPCELSKSRQQMDECQRLANFARPDDNDDWDEKIDKGPWSGLQTRLWSRVYRILTSEYLARLTKTTSNVEPINRRMSIDSAAKKFRQLFASTGYDWRLIHWLHSLLFDNLPKEYLTIYLDILQTLRGKIPQLIDKVITTQPNITTKTGAINWETLGSLLKRSWDPLAVCLNTSRPKKLPGNPIIIVTPSGIGNNISSRQLKWISQLGCLGMVVNIHSHLGLTNNRMNMTSCMDQLIQMTRAKIQEIRSDYPGRPLILVGFNSGAALACQIAQIEHVTAIICLGFPFSTVEGKRGTPDDILMDIRCPVMFVIGQYASIVRPDDLEEIREKMLVETSLIVVGTADDHLRISTRKKTMEGITQSMVDRCILDEIGGFVGEILLQPHPLPLRHISMLNCDQSKNVGNHSVGVKKEARKRKHSTSSSVESSETNMSGGKKSRPATPTVVPSIPGVVPGTGELQVTVQIPQGQPVLPKHTSASIYANAGFPGIKRNIKSRTPKITMGSNNGSLSRQGYHQSSNTNGGGITLNIGSLASLSPIGPIKLTPNSMTQSSTVKTPVISKSPAITLSKLSKPSTQSDITTTSIHGGQSFEKLVANPCRNSQEKWDSNTSESANIPCRADKQSLTTASLTTLAHPPKTEISKNNQLKGETTSSVFVAPSEKTESSTPTTNSPLMSQVPETLNHPRVCESTSSMMENGPVVIDGNSIHISRISSKLKISQTIPKITLNISNTEKSNLKKSKINNSISDFENILDIPIIFAKDDDNLTALEQIPPSIDISSSKVTDKNLSSKMVILSDKEDCSNGDSTQVVPKCEEIKLQNFHRPLYFQSRLQSPLLSNIKYIGHNSILHSTANNSIKTIGDKNKCTKIILTKKKS